MSTKFGVKTQIFSVSKLAVFTQTPPLIGILARQKPNVYQGKFVQFGRTKERF